MIRNTCVLVSVCVCVGGGGGGCVRACVCACYCLRFTGKIYRYDLKRKENTGLVPVWFSASATSAAIIIYTEAPQVHILALMCVITYDLYSFFS